MINTLCFLAKFIISIRTSLFQIVPVGLWGEIKTNTLECSKHSSNKLKSMIESKLENKGNAKEYYKNKIEEYQAKIKKIEEEEGKK